MLVKGVKLPTKSEIIALGLKVNGTYSNNQLVQEKDIIKPIEYDGQIIVAQDGTYEITDIGLPIITEELTSKTLKANDVYCRYKTKVINSTIKSFSITYTYNGRSYKYKGSIFNGNLSTIMTLDPSIDKFITDPGLTPGF